MEVKRSQADCQIPCLQQVADSVADHPPESLPRRIKLLIRRRMSPSQERAFKKRTNDLMNRMGRLTGRGTKPSVSAPPWPNTYRLVIPYVCGR